MKNDKKPQVSLKKKKKSKRSNDDMNKIVGLTAIAGGLFLVTRNKNDHKRKTKSSSGSLRHILNKRNKGEILTESEQKLLSENVEKVKDLELSALGNAVDSIANHDFLLNVNGITSSRYNNKIELSLCSVDANRVLFETSLDQDVVEANNLLSQNVFFSTVRNLDGTRTVGKKVEQEIVVIKEASSISQYNVGQNALVKMIETDDSYDKVVLAFNRPIGVQAVIDVGTVSFLSDIVMYDIPHDGAKIGAIVLKPASVEALVFDHIFDKLELGGKRKFLCFGGKKRVATLIRRYKALKEKGIVIRYLITILHDGCYIYGARA